MTSKAIWIGITIGVFIAGIGIGYAVFQSTQPGFMHMTPQQMQQMMSDPNFMAQWHQNMMNNPQVMNNWMGTMMNDPQAMQQMHDIMMQNPQHMSMMMGPMVNTMIGDPQLSQQMMSTIMQHNQFMQGMLADPQFQQNWMGSWMMNNTNWRGMMGPGMMGQGMMGPGMMGQGMMGPDMMMGSPITSESDVLKTIDKVEDLLDQVSSSYRDSDTNQAFSLATTAYLENYEYIEGSIASKDNQLMEKIELMLRRDLRNMINTGEPFNEVDAHIDSIKQELAKVKELFQ